MAAGHTVGGTGDKGMYQEGLDGAYEEWTARAQQELGAVLGIGVRSDVGLQHSVIKVPVLPEKSPERLRHLKPSPTDG